MTDENEFENEEGEVIIAEAIFRVAASDTHGHTAREWFSCQPGHSNQVQAIIQSKRFPYRVKGDLYRHALLRHLRWLEDVGGIASVMHEVDIILDILRDEEFRKEFKAVIDKLSESVSYHLGHNDTREAVRLILLIKDRVSKMPEGFWRSRYEKKIEENYGGILKSAPLADLTDFEDDL